MTDQCKHCTLRGDIDKCLQAECRHHENWISEQHRKRYSSLMQENAELQAQLARCVKVVKENSRQLHIMCRRGTAKDLGVLAVAMNIDVAIHTLTKSATLDAEILKCAEELYEFQEQDNLNGESATLLVKEFYSLNTSLKNAVRTRREYD